MLSSMFSVTEADAAAIRAVYEKRGELSAAVELRRRFPIGVRLWLAEALLKLHDITSYCRNLMKGNISRSPIRRSVTEESA
jgi:hypothetical protein